MYKQVDQLVMIKEVCGHLTYRLLLYMLCLYMYLLVREQM